MAISSTNLTELSYDLETVAGVTDDPFTGQVLPIISNALMSNIDTAVSEVIRDDRQTDELVLVDSSVNGDVGYELTYVPYKPLMISLLQNTGAAGTIDGSSVNVNFATPIGSIQTIIDTAAGAIFATAVKGQFVKISGAADAGNNGSFKVAAKTSDDEIDVVNAAGVLNATDTGGVAFKGDSFRNGAAQVDSYTFRKKYTAPDGTLSFFYHSGCQIGTMSYDFETGSIITGATNITGRSELTATTPQFNDAITPIQDYELLNSVSSIIDIAVTGIPATTEFTNITINVNNNINEAKALGTLGAADLASFMLEVGGDITLYFEDISVWDNFIKSTVFTITVVLEDATGNQLVMDFPKCKFTTLEVPVPGKDEFLFASGTWMALRDEVNDYMVQFTFVDA